METAIMDIKTEGEEEYKIDIKTCYLEANNLKEILLPEAKRNKITFNKYTKLIAAHYRY